MMIASLSRVIIKLYHVDSGLTGHSAVSQCPALHWFRLTQLLSAGWALLGNAEYLQTIYVINRSGIHF